MVHPPNTFLQFWRKRELKGWIRELEWRARYPVIYKTNAPTLRQTKAELKRRKKG